jgi:hypothetical protein
LSEHRARTALVRARDSPDLAVTDRVRSARRGVAWAASSRATTLSAVCIAVVHYTLSRTRLPCTIASMVDDPAILLERHIRLIDEPRSPATAPRKRRHPPLQAHGIELGVELRDERTYCRRRSGACRTAPLE